MAKQELILVLNPWKTFLDHPKLLSTCSFNREFDISVSNTSVKGHTARFILSMTKLLFGKIQAVSSSQISQQKINIGRWWQGPTGWEPKGKLASQLQPWKKDPRKTAIIPDIPDIPSLIYIVAYFFPFSCDLFITLIFFTLHSSCY